MDYHLVLQNVLRHIALNNEEIPYFTSLLNYKEVARKEFLLQAGNVAKHINFIHAGALKAYYLDVKSDENIIMLAVDDWWITDMYSFTTGKPAMQFIPPWKTPRYFNYEKKILTCPGKDPSFRKVFQNSMQNAYIREQLRVIQNLSMPAEERYLNFLKKYPQLVQRVTQKQIASYIGVSPEFFSAIRKRMLKK